jgi:ParB family chromosome partitioning protein
MSELLSARVDQIVESRWQPREGVGDPAAFQELVASVKLHGVTAPLKAFADGDGTYELVTGHRRWRAAAQAGLTHVPLVVVDAPQDEAALQALHEEVLFDNLLHEPLTPLEEARAFQVLHEEGYSLRQIARRLGKSKTYVSDRFRLLSKPEEVQQLVSARPTTLRHALEIAKVEDSELRSELVEEARAGATLSDVKARVDEIVFGGDRSPGPDPERRPPGRRRNRPRTERRGPSGSPLVPLDQVICHGDLVLLTRATCAACELGRTIETDVLWEDLYRNAGEVCRTCPVREIAESCAQCPMVELLGRIREHLAMGRIQEHLAGGEKAGGIEQMLTIHPEWSDRRIASSLGVSPGTVGKYRQELESTSQIEKMIARETADGKVRLVSK